MSVLMLFGHLLSRPLPYGYDGFATWFWSLLYGYGGFATWFWSLLYGYGGFATWFWSLLYGYDGSATRFWSLLYGYDGLATRFGFAVVGLLWPPCPFRSCVCNLMETTRWQWCLAASVVGTVAICLVKNVVIN